VRETYLLNNNGYNKLHFTEGGEFACVTCGTEFIHLFDASPLLDPDSVRDRPHIELLFWCEGCSSGMEWDIGNHKGITDASAHSMSSDDLAKARKDREERDNIESKGIRYFGAFQ